MNIGSDIHILHGDCCELMTKIPDESIDAIISDPPYLYLKEQKLDTPFNEPLFFAHAKRVLKKGGFIVLFGRGTAFYRWNTLLADLGFIFKEEIIWNKVQTTSPVLPLNRIHETVSIHCKGKGKINKVRVPYLEMKGHDIGAIKQDIKRLMTIFSNTKSFEAVKQYLENAEAVYSETYQSKHTIATCQKMKNIDSGVSCIQGLVEGLKEKSIIYTPIYDKPSRAKHFTSHTGIINGCNRSVSVLDSMTRGYREKTIIRQTRDHYTMEHPTQKPVRLMERLMALVTQDNALVLDPFMGSGTTGIACINTGRRFIGMELDSQYFNIAQKRVTDALNEKQQTLFYEQKGVVNE